jgi:hypothetical protein
MLSHTAGKRKFHPDSESTQDVPSKRQQPRSPKAICDDCKRLNLPSYLSQHTERQRLEPGNKNPDMFYDVWPYTVADVGDRFRRMPASNCLLCQFFYICRRKHELWRQEQEADPTSSPNDDEGADQIVAKPWRFIGYDLETSIPNRNGKQPQYPILLLSVEPRKAVNQDEIPKLQANETLPMSVTKRNTKVPCEDTAAPAVSYDFPLEDEDLHHDINLLMFKDLDQPFGHVPSEMPLTFNVRRAIEWLQYCEKNHALCRKHLNPIIDGFQLINCETLAVEPAESSRKYVTLSYVWGRQESSLDEIAPGSVPQEDSAHLQSSQDLEQSTFPQVIKDAILVTKNLGFRYLWVDKYCIDQDDADAKHGQIQQMDAIYEGAALTITAACGLNDSNGLPGVSTAARRLQKVATYEGIKLLWIKARADDYIRFSHWSTRGWTYQEAILSRKRLVFTEGEIYFECNTMHCRESDYQFLDAIHIKDKSKTYDSLDKGIFRASRSNPRIKDPDRQSLGQSFCQYLTFVEDYTGRNLSYETDSLNAFQGIIRMFKKRKLSLAQVEGLPYPAILNSPHRQNLWFAWSLSWYHTSHCWSGPVKPKRRYDFPSWSWAGWDSKVEYTLRDLGPTSTDGLDILDLTVSFEDANGKISKFHEYNESDMQRCKAIHLTARCVPPSAFSYIASSPVGMNHWDLYKYDAHLFLSESALSEDQFAVEFNDENHWRAIYLSTVLFDVFVMVLKFCTETQSWSRAGIFVVNGDPWIIDEKISQNSKYATTRIV